MDNEGQIVIEDVYLAYGRTMHALQRLERIYLNVRGLVEVAEDTQDKDSGTPASLYGKAEAMIGRLKGGEKTLGRAFKRLHGTSKNKEFLSFLTDTQNLRNTLAHSFIVDGDLKTDSGRSAAFEKLAEMERRFRYTCENFVGGLESSLRKNGLPDTTVTDMISRIDPGGPPRKASEAS